MFPVSSLKDEENGITKSATGNNKSKYISSKWEEEKDSSMHKFIYFNPRLTAKLNAIHQYPLTLVSGGAGVGKSFVVQSFLGSSRSEVIWHASKAPDFPVFLREFRKNYAVINDSIEDVFQMREEKNIIPASMAVEIAAAVKRNGLQGHRAYVLEYQEEAVPEDILSFLYYLSSQRIRWFYVILISRKTQAIAALEQPDASANVIAEDDFLAYPAEIKQAFARNGVSIEDEEANDIYLRTAGWMPSLKQIYELMLQNGRDGTYAAASEEVKRFLVSDHVLAGAWENFIFEEGDFWNAPELKEVRRQAESMECERGLISVEHVRVKAPRFSALWDACDYYNALLLALCGQCAKALDGLNRAFESRVREGRFQSAFRLLLSQLQVRILMGDHWFEDERKLLLYYANKRFYEGNGITRTAAAFTLLQTGETRRLAALLTGETVGDAIDAAWQSFLLAAACQEIGFREEAVRYLAEGKAAVEASGACLPMLILYDPIAAGRRGKGHSETEWSHVSPRWREKLAALRRAMKKNSGEISSGSWNRLTVRESEIAECAARKMTNKEIAAQLNISENTVKTTLKRAFQKLGISGRAELIS